MPLPLGYKHSPDTRTKMSEAQRRPDVRSRKSEAMKRVYQSTEARERTRLSSTGRHHSSETRERLSIARRSRGVAPPVTAITRAKMSARRKGVNKSALTRLRISAGRRKLYAERPDILARQVEKRLLQRVYLNVDGAIST